jgi:hypothetical protein
MTSAILQGVPGTTLDTDLWVDMPTRGYLALHRLIVEQGGTALAKTVFALEDDSVVNFVFAVDGLNSFGAEYK